MPIIRIKVSSQEFHAIEEYAHQCGESASELVRKSVIREATLADYYGQLDDSYDFAMKIPDGCSASTESVIRESNYNKIREIMGLTKISLPR